MQISSNLSEQEIKDLQQSFYEYFETGYAFEEFLKEYLLKMGLDEVEVTKRSRDGGIDLKAVRKGVGDFSDIDVTHYYIQAKRYALSNKVNVSKIRELKGTIPFGDKGMMITTSDFTADAISEASNDPSKPVVIISGKSLVMSCIDHKIGFLFKPIFSKEQMDLFLNLNRSQNIINQVNSTSAVNHENTVEKTITANDIRARIVSIPSSIMRQYDDEQTSMKVIVNNEKEYTFNINKGRNYFGSVTSFLRDYNMLSNEGVITPKQCKWFYNVEEKNITLYIEDKQ